MLRRSLIVVFLLACGGPVSAQDIGSCGSLPGHVDDNPGTWQRFLQLHSGAGQNPLLWWRGSSQSCAPDGISAGVVRTRLEYNSAYPVDRNNGALWAGRGVSALVSAGIRGRWRAISAQLQPEAVWSQNRDFERLPGRRPGNPLSNPFYSGIDLPQRFGDDAYSSVHAGQSYVRADAGRIGGGISTENVWWGAGLREAIVLSNSAAGMPHVFFDLRPVDVYVGRISATALWGRATESAYYDSISANDRRLITGIAVAFEPWLLPNLFIGGTRMYSTDWEDRSLGALFPFFEPVLKEGLVTEENPGGNNVDDQRLSVFFRWLFPASGVEVYGEYGREDHSWDFTDLIQEPEHSAAYLLGLQHARDLGGEQQLRIHGEWVNLQQLAPNRPGVRATPRYYTKYPHGHTHGGQMLGAGIGVGSEAQFLAADLVTPRGTVGGFVERVRRDAMSDTAIAARTVLWPPRHDVELTAGVRAQRTVADFTVSGQLSLSRRLNRNWVADETNARLVMEAAWKPN